jgi:hypothetical protein
MFRQTHDNGIHVMLQDHLAQLVIRPDNEWLEQRFLCSGSRLVQKSDDLQHQPGFRPDDLTQVNGQLPCPKNEEPLPETWRAP